MDSYITTVVWIQSVYYIRLISPNLHWYENNCWCERKLHAVIAIGLMGLVGSRLTSQIKQISMHCMVDFSGKAYCIILRNTFCGSLYWSLLLGALQCMKYVLTFTKIIRNLYCSVTFCFRHLSDYAKSAWKMSDIRL